MKPVRIGIIGCGVMGARHAAVVAGHAEMELAAVADVRADVARTVAEQTGALRAYDSAEALIDDREVEAVIIALPAGLRTPIALRALNAGKHTLLEKPIATSAAEVQELIAARGSLVGGVCSCRFRCFESAKVAAATVANGTLGPLRVVHFRGILADNGPRSRPLAPWRVSHRLNGGGFWVNWGSYDLDFVMGVTGWTLKPRIALAQTWPVADHLPDRVADDSDAEEHAIALVRCEGGVVLSMERGESMPLSTPSLWQIVGANASLRLDMLGTERTQVLLDRSDPDGPVTTDVLWEGDNDWEITARQPLIDFARAIRTGREPMTSFERGLVMQKITDAIYESAETGRAVEIQ
ncbi:MAG: hypothetical protein CMJ18_22080 [Phycisphaeraceae bacterium]|nr:hypothetical protein [Phycisphaeraceae bacterium]